MNDIYSFYQLISKYKIEIPIIQRDYAQGRKDSKAEDVRKSMVADMIAAVKGEKKLFFDFVYGRIDHQVFIPFDGQQRLTTLFLFHKYVFEKCISCSTCEYKSNCICKDVLLRFSYATRQSSREFCERLVKENVIPDNTKSLSQNIRNMQWFYSDWEKDPTIMGMLTMLDEIHNQFSKQDIKDYKPLAEKLTSGCDCPITFHFVDMGEHKLSDETYVKMNARGKQLTPFENFKASLEQYLEEKGESDFLSRFKGTYEEQTGKHTGIDGIWLDMFWKISNPENKEEKEIPDSIIMSFINRHFINVWICWYGDIEAEKQKKYDSFNQRIISDMPLYPKKDDFVSWDIYQNVLDNRDISSKCLTPIFNIWDKLCEQNQDNINEDCQATWNRGDGKEKWNIINSDNRETYSSRVAFYALLRYFGGENEETKTTLSQWMRIVWNIIETPTIDSFDTYQAALRLIDKLSGKCHDIYDALANHFEDFELGSQYHAQEQVKEEIAKANQILYGGQRSDGKSWEEIIIEAEKYAFFHGSIRFLFTQKDIGDDWEHFDAKWANAQKYFDENGVKEEYKDNAILLRALLSRINIGGNWFGYKKDFWRASLLSNDYQNAIHYLLTTNKLETEPNCKQDWIVDDNLLQVLFARKDNYNWRILNNWRGFSVLTTYSQRRSDADSQQIIVLNYQRNNILRNDDITVHENNKIENTKYLYGWDIQFTYKYGNEEYYFQWHREGYVRMIKDLGNCEPIVKDESKDAPEEKWYCFRPTQEMASDTSLFTKELYKLIEQSQKS
jgi:hypothetical protein